MQGPMIRKLSSTFVEKVWGVEKLPAPFSHPSKNRIGEVWFEPPPELQQLLVKYIFASERLSVQAHPSDTQARSMNLGRSGKSECWVILDAAPDATIAAGFHEEITPNAMTQAAIDGSIVDMLVWHEVRPRDTFYIPAGTVHAIGGGVSLIEVQQNNDITFRLFDYGRPRELHLDQAMKIAKTGPYQSEYRSRLDTDAGVLLDGPHFSLSFWQCGSSSPAPPLEDRPTLLIPFSGEASIGNDQLVTGECALALDFDPQSISGDCLLLLAQPNSTC